MKSLLGTSMDEALALLQHFRWDKEKLLDDYFSAGDKVREDVGLGQSIPPFPSASGGGGGVISCRICYDEAVPLSESYALDCGHHFCLDCYRGYLQAQLTEGPLCILTHCPEHKCKLLVPRSVFEHLLSSVDLARYDEFLLRNYINNSKYMRHCPAPRCDKVAIGQGVVTIFCSCGTTFCFKCGEDAHEPCSCAQLIDWAAKCRNESETANWILANTRKCPACQTRIEKNQGCNHMTCRICKHEFCWICMGSWTEHGQNTGGFYKCNRFTALETNSSASEAARAKAELDRYLHYYQRYHGHDQGLQYAQKRLEKIDQILTSPSSSSSSGVPSSSYADVQFLKSAAELVITCRRVLKYTYVLGYFLPDNTPEKQLYEYHQEMLEKNTERLQEMLEKPSESLDQAQVVNLTRVTERFMGSLLQSMTGGVVRLDEANIAKFQTSLPQQSMVSSSAKSRQAAV